MAHDSGTWKARAGDAATELGALHGQKQERFRLLKPRRHTRRCQVENADPNGKLAKIAGAPILTPALGSLRELKGLLILL